MRLRYFFSISRNMGKVERTLMTSGLPAWMPATIGSAILSSASRPRRRRTKSPRLSSPPPRAAAPRGSTRSRPMRALPGHEIRELACERHETRRHHEDQPLGQLVQPPARVDEALADVLVGVEHALFDAELAGELDRPRLLDDERVRSALDDEAVEALRAHLAAQAPVLLEQKPVDGPAVAALALELVGRAEPGHAAADHGDAAPLLLGHEAHPAAGCERSGSGRSARYLMTASASAATQRGESLAGSLRR